ncbi:NADPH-dependent F420 reductase [Nocardia huaxiensis]|uniref:NAD(P)-binding domain-containing protein n=1 Tax=Nocardia huaxiensis TaxID=2755382 RepID=A0A7D6ZLE0_9NOCA|nr:NAD(P)-binding domain-containing protein [Nocardia huaxiensis]QLY32520.1 NAD(P)-binding domain-containing protein [Nocardia huaxiensis]UFS93769.1 NAD(P)-binding domain-containing protein [Nocardia huaxiensis]
MRVGLIGTGRIGGNLARLLVAGGDEVLLSAGRPDGPKALADELGAHATATSPLDAIAAADVVVIAVWWEAFPEIALEYGAALQGRIVVDPSNPLTERDGQIVRLPIPDGLTSPQYQLRRLGDVRLVRTFGDRPAADLLADGQRGQGGGARGQMRYWSDDPLAAATVLPLIRDAGFEPVDGGGLAQSKNAGE